VRTMVLDGLSGSLRDTLRKIANAPFIDKDLIKEVVRDIQRAMIQADVNVQLVVQLTREIESRALTEKPPPGMNNREHVIKIVHDELVNILGSAKGVRLKSQRIMLVGLYGQGKTTTAGKLAGFYSKRGLKVGLVAGDVHRPAAIDQLAQIADQVNVPIYLDRSEKDAAKLVKRGLVDLKDRDVIIIDTAGRHALEDDLIREMERIAKVSHPDEILLVIDAAVGQQAGPQAKAFHEAVGVSGVIITKMDGTAKGGGALSAVQETKAPVMFIGVGEHLDELERFEPARFISRLLGMGDLQALLEKAEEIGKDQDLEATAKKMLSGRFTLRDLYDQMEALTKMGPLSKVFEMLPAGLTGRMGAGDIEMTQTRLKTFRVIMDSMTEEEMNNPQMIKSSRVKRIALGAGVEPKDVKGLLKQYNQSRKAIKGMTSNRKMRRALMKQFEGMDIDL
jgi:signal recognition particle subunit SRP54